MTVPIIPTLPGGVESSSKLLNSSNNSEEIDVSLSFNATMNEIAPVFDFDDQRYVLADGQVLSAEQLLEVLENGNPLPGLNLPSLSELQQYKFQEGLSNPKFKPVMSVTGSEKTPPLDITNKIVNDKFVLTQHPLVNNQPNLSVPMKAGAVVPEQFLISLTATNKQVHTEMPATGFTAAYGYQLVSGSEGMTGLTSNTFNISTPVQHPQWNQSLGQSVQWMVNQNIQQAEIKLNPPDLGMLDIRITVNNDQATVHFAAQNSAVRDALESAMPRLRDMLEASGVTLADVNVSEHSQQHTHAEHDNDRANTTQNRNLEDNSNPGVRNESENSISRMQLGLLDIYA